METFIAVLSILTFTAIVLFFIWGYKLTGGK